MSVVHYLQYVKRLFAACKYSIRFYSLVLWWNRHDKNERKKEQTEQLLPFLDCVCVRAYRSMQAAALYSSPPGLHWEAGARKSHLVRLAWERTHTTGISSSLSLALFLSVSVSLTHTLTYSHACTQYYPHHKLMSHYIVISVLFAPPCLSTICHTLHMVMTHKLKSCCRFQREGFHACMHTNTHTLHTRTHTVLCRFAFCVYIVLIEGFCLCFFLFCFCVLLASHSFPHVKRRQTLNPSWYPLWILITMLFPAGGPQKEHVI